MASINFFALITLGAISSAIGQISVQPNGPNKQILKMPEMYEFEYNVKDCARGKHLSRVEISDGEIIRGEYYILLENGMTQIVTYAADSKTGFSLNVRYEWAHSNDCQTNTNTNNDTNNRNFITYLLDESILEYESYEKTDYWWNVYSSK